MRNDAVTSGNYGGFELRRNHAGTSITSSDTMYTRDVLSTNQTSIYGSISEDKESFLLEVPTFGGGGYTGGGASKLNNRPVSPLHEDAENEDEAESASETKKSECSPPHGSAIAGRQSDDRQTTDNKSSVSQQQQQQPAPHHRNNLLRKCYPSSNDQMAPPFLPSGSNLNDCLPTYYHGKKAILKLIKVRDHPSPFILFYLARSIG